MAKAKRRIVRPYARRHKGGWIILKEAFLKALQDASIAEMNGIAVGARQLRQIIQLIPTEDCLLVKANGRLEVETIDRVMRKRNGHLRTEFRKARLEQSFRMESGVWIPANPTLTVIIKPKKYA
ncbi:hypothetical protein ES703_118873 [subsurface metagenome]